MDSFLAVFLMGSIDCRDKTVEINYTRRLNNMFYEWMGERLLEGAGVML